MVEQAAAYEGDGWGYVYLTARRDSLEAGTRESDRGPHSLFVSEDGERAVFEGVGTFPLRDGGIFERDGDLVIRVNNDGYGYEYVFRVA